MVDELGAYDRDDLRRDDFDRFDDRDRYDFERDMAMERAREEEMRQMERDRAEYTPAQLKKYYSNVAIAGATLGGGPVAGASMAAFLKTPPGRAIINNRVEATYSGASRDRQKKRARTGRNSAGREAIRSSGQFNRANLLMGINPKPRKKNKKHCKNLSTCFRQANAKLRLKNGSLRKGKTQSDVAKMAHRLLKKMK